MSPTFTFWQGPTAEDPLPDTTGVHSRPAPRPSASPPCTSSRAAPMLPVFSVCLNPRESFPVAPPGTKQGWSPTGGAGSAASPCSQQPRGVILYPPPRPRLSLSLMPPPRPYARSGTSVRPRAEGAEGLEQPPEIRPCRARVLELETAGNEQCGKKASRSFPYLAKSRHF